MMYLYIGYEVGIIKHIYTSDKKMHFAKVECYECHTMSEVIDCLMRNEETRHDIIRLIDDKDVFILKGWDITIAHKVLVNSFGSDAQIWIENDKGELELL